ncbi:hypothetical protein [Actinomadura rugatobispora]|uniref:Uncharacterized protein n=1 Tax=Actinomadura rugatobispora TaxID=1994 RepID=A0ABW1AA56_9ACTN|nr:hypothetical protein GCM10010200_074960 [Actinomadura rugatobispora]
MIILSGVLVVVAIALLVAGIVAGNGESAQVLGLDALVVIYISIAVSVVSALCLAIGVFLRRKELFGSGAPAAKRTRQPAKPKGKKKPERPAARSKTPAPPPGDDTVRIQPPSAEVPDDAVVYVVRGRKRYHLDTCRQLAGRDREELTYAEAKEEGFSPCTACMPDTALAARAAVTVPAGKTAAKTAEIPVPADSPPDPLSKPETKASGVTEAPADETSPLRADPPATSPAPAREPEAGSGHPAEPTAPLPSAWPAPATAADIPAERTPGDDVTVRILSGTKRYHRVDCALIEDIGDETEDLESVSRAEAKTRGCTPCLVCQPDA